MKKNLFFAALAAIAFASCANDDLLVDDVTTNETQKEIGFDTYAPTMTRAENSDVTSKTALENHHTNFTVWASKMAGTYQEVWGAGATPSKGTVEYKEATTSWTASPAKFWDRSATNYYFFAAAPAQVNATPANDWSIAWKNSTAASLDYSDAYISLAGFSVAGNNISTVSTSQTGTAPVAATIKNGVTLYDGSGNEVAATAIVKDGTYYKDAEHTTAAVKGTDYTEPVAASADYCEANMAKPYPAASFKTVADMDLMIASPKTVGNSAFGQKVNLEFNHILSRLNIMVKKDVAISGNAVNLKGLTVYAMDNTGTFTENTTLSTGTLAGGTTERWTSTSGSSTHTASAVAFDNVDTKSRYVLETLVIPQKIAYEAVTVGTEPTKATRNAYIKIEYSVDGENFYGYYNLAKAFGVASGNVAFNEGWQNNLTIIIKPDLIEFSAEVFDWKNGTEKDINVPN